MRVGFIGLGIMGLSMARNLRKAGFALSVYNRTPARAEFLASEGAAVVASPEWLARESDIVLSCVTDTPDVEDVLLGPAGAIRGGRPGTIVVDMSTISPEATRRIAAEFESKGMEMLDAPVTGGDVGARNGTLAIMVGGKREVFEKAKPVLAAMGKHIVHVGDHGAGQIAKLCNQILCAVNLVGLCEAISLCRQAGIDPARMLEVTGAGAGGSWALSNLGPKILSGDLEPAFMVALMQKDLRLVRELAQRVGSPMHGTPVAQTLFSKVESLGGTRQGTQAMIRAYGG